MKPSADPLCESDAGNVPAPAGLGAVARRGMTWMTGAAILTKFASVAAQLVLAWLLAPRDFGLYAAAIGVAGFVTAFRDGGVTTYLIRYGVREYDSLAGPVFWFSFIINVAAAAVLAGLGLSIGVIGRSLGLSSDSPLLAAEFPALLYVIALSMPLGTPGAILRTKMRLDLRFRELSVMSLASSVVRYIGAMGLALSGAGAQSFVLPLLGIALLEWIWGQASTRDRAWLWPPGPARWPGIFEQSKWLLLGTLGSVVYNMGAYSLVALFVGAATVGMFFFAYQMTQQVCALITTNLQFVLAPVLVHIHDQSERLRAAALRTLRVLMIFAVPLMLGMSVTIDPVERLVLGGKWREAVIPIVIFGALTPMALTWGLTYSILTSLAMFRTWALLSLAEGALVTAAATAAAAMWGTSLSISIATAASMMLTRLWITIHSMRLVGVSAGEVVRASAGAWWIGLAAGFIAMVAGGALCGGNSIAQLLISGTVFGVLYTAGVRLAMPDSLADSITVAPGRMRGALLRLLRLPVNR